MKKTIKNVIRRCTVLALILIVSIGPVASYAANVDMTKLINGQSQQVIDITKNLSSFAKPKIPPTFGDAVVNATKDSLTSGTSTIGGEVIGKGIDFINKHIGDSDNIKSAISIAQKKGIKYVEKGKAIAENMVKGKGRALATMTKKLSKNAGKIVKNQGVVTANTRKLFAKKGLKVFGKGMAIYGIYSDSEALIKGDYKHKHTSMRFVRDSLLGSNIAINGFLLTPWGQVPVIKQGGELFALGLGVTKDFVTSDTFAKYMNSKNNVVLKTADNIMDNTNEYWSSAFESWLTKWYKHTGAHMSDAELAKAEEQHKKWLEYKKKGLGRKPGDNVGVYKPNVYLYPEEETSIRVTFQMPGLLQTVIPEYPGQWMVTGYPDGTIKGADGEFYTYLFYESITWPCMYQTDEGWLIQADTRSEQMESIMFSYGFTEQETADFIEYWTVKLDQGTDYAMYPQVTSIVDIAMPMDIEPKPDSLFRLWFVFEKNVVPSTVPILQYIERKGFTAVEWGGIILP